jgi:hypothetical protein
MDRIRLIRGSTGARCITPPPWESRYTLFLKLVSRHKADGLVLGHYVTNPVERPDYVFQHDCRARRFVRQSDFGTTRWTVKAITPEEDALLEQLPGEHRSENLIVLSDNKGNVILQDFCTADEATRTLGLVECAQMSFASEYIGDESGEPALTKRKTPLEQTTDELVSRHTFTGNQPNLRIMVGWDRPLQSYFAQVWDGGELGSGNLLLWAGAEAKRVPTIDALVELLAPFGRIPDEVLDELRQAAGFECYSLLSRI